MCRTGKVTAGILAGLLCFAVVAGSLPSSQAQNGRPSSQRENAPAQDGRQVKATPAKGGGMSSGERVVRDVYARLMRYHTAARDEASVNLGVVYKAEDYITFGVNDVKTGSMEEIIDRPLSELVTPRGGQVINLKPNYLRGADGLAHASYDALWTPLSEAGLPDQTALPTVLQAGGEKYKDAVNYTSYEVTVSLEGKRRTYRAMALHFNPGGKDGKSDTEILDSVTSDMNAVLAEMSPRIRSPWARYVRSNLHNAIVDSISEKERVGQPLIPADAPIGYLPGDDIEAANRVLASAADSCNPDPPDVTISNVKAVIKGGFADFQITLNPSPSAGPVYLDLYTADGTGQALFDINNSPFLTINESSTVRIKGVTESSSVNNIILSASFEDFTLVTKNFTVIKVELKEVAFGGDSYVPIRKDDNTDYFTAPHWQDNSSPLDGDANDPGDRKYPVAYVRHDSIVTASVTLIIRPSVSLDGVTINIRGEGPGNLDFPAKSVTTSAGSSGDRLVIDDLRTPSNISSAVECIDCSPPPAPPEGIKWEVSVTQPTGATTWKEVGTSRNRVYVLLDPPVGFTTTPPFTRPLLETIVHLACIGAKGKSTTNDVFNGIWTVFSAPNSPLGESPIKTADDSRRLNYYNPKDAYNTTSIQLINAGNGQCGSWSRLMIDSARAHGITGLRFPIVSRIDDVTTLNLGFLVKNWTFTTGPGKSGDSVYPYINVIANKDALLTPSTYFSAVHTYTYKDVTDTPPGIAGKGSADPSSIFNNHQFIEYTNPTTGVTTWYDPSYGVTYPGTTDTARLNSVATAIDGLYQLKFTTVNESVLDFDVNGNGTKTDVITGHPVLIIKKKPAGTILKYEYQSY